jgi:hypothetical protein
MLLINCSLYRIVESSPNKDEEEGEGELTGRGRAA